MQWVISDLDSFNFFFCFFVIEKQDSDCLDHNVKPPIIAVAHIKAISNIW